MKFLTIVPVWIVLASTAWAADLFVPGGYSTIQAAINVANPGGGDTVHVDAGTFPEQLVIDRSLTLVGSGIGITVILCPAVPAADTLPGSLHTNIITVRGIDVTAAVRNVTVKAQPSTVVGTPLFHGVFVRDGAHADIEDDSYDMAHSLVSGAAILIGYSASGQTGSATVCRNHLSQFTECGILVDGAGSSATIQDNMVVGVGLSGVHSQKGVRISGGANATVEFNEIRNLVSSSGSAAAGISFRDAGSGTSSVVQRNQIHDSQYGIEYVAGAAGGLVQNNCLMDNQTGAYIAGDAGAVIQIGYNNIAGNSVAGIDNHAASTVTAENNWWGASTGPTNSGNPGGTGDAAVGSVDYRPWLTKPVNGLSLDAAPASLYVRPGENVLVDLNVANLHQLVNGCQALIGYSSYYFPAAGTVVPGGGAWTELIFEDWRSGTGELDAAIGVRLGGSGGTDADGTVAVLSLAAGAREGTTRLVFRPDGTEGYATMLSDLNARAVWPVKVDSSLIVIDGTAPTLSIDSAFQHGPEDELLTENGSTETARVGTVWIVVSAADDGAGLAACPAVTVTPQGGPPESADLIDENPTGIFNYTWKVLPATPHGLAAVNATVSDRSDNTTAAVAKHFDVDSSCGPDFDYDGDVDGFDFLTFSNCFNSSNRPPLSACENLCADLEGDDDVDGFDFLSFSNCYNGSNRPPLCP